MTRSGRLTLGVVLGLLFAVGGSIYTVARMVHWHRIGSMGASILPPQAKPVTLPGTLRDYEPQRVLLIFPGGAAERAGLRTGDRVLAINGIPYRDEAAIRALDARVRRGDPVVYLVERDGRQVTIHGRAESPLANNLTNAQVFIYGFTGWTFILIGLFVFWRNPDDRRVVVFYATTAVSAAYLLLSLGASLDSGVRGIAPSAGGNVVTIVLSSVFALAFLPLILHLALVFPRERPVLTSWPRVLRFLYLYPLLPAAAAGVALPLMVLARRFRTNPTAQVVVAGAALLAAAMIGFALIRVARRAPHRPWRALLDHPTLLLGSAVVLVAAVCTGLTVAGHRFPALVVVGVFAMVTGFSLFGYFIVAFIALLRSYREASAEEKRQVAWPLWGTMIAIGVRVVVALGGLIVGGLIRPMQLDASRVLFLVQSLELVSRVIYLLIPISFAVAILKYRLMNIDVIIRKTVVYAILSGAIVIIYLTIVGGLGSFLVFAFGLENQTTMIIGSTLVVALLFVPVRNKLQTLVDRNLFRHRYDYPEALRAIAAELRTAEEAGAFLVSAAETLQRALQNRAVVIFLERQDEYVAAAKLGVADALVGQLRVSRAMSGQLDRPFDPRRRTLPDDAARALARVEAALVAPVGSRGFIAFAPKLSGGEFDVEDIDFVRSAADQIEAGIDRIRVHEEEEDFAQARAIQQSLLPREMPRVEKLDVSGMWQPARTMGGDYFDLLPLGDAQLAFCIGDVAGKGMPAALLMSGLQAAVRASASNSPRDLCERVRRVVVSTLSGGRFVTFFYATVDTAAMRLRWCNAGHNAPILARADGSVARLAEGGPAFSRLFQSAAYEEREIAVQPGDRIVLFTDGVSEAADAAGEQFGETRIEEIVTRAPREMTAHALQEAIVDAASAFSGGELEDDVTLVVVRITD